MAMMIVHYNTFLNYQTIWCGHTKSSLIIKRLGDKFKAELVDDMKMLPFSFRIDGSNDTGIAKMYLITVCIYDVNFNRVMTKFFDMNLIEGSTRGTAVTC